MPRPIKSTDRNRKTRATGPGNTVVCRDAKEFMSEMRALCSMDGPCFLDECPKSRHLGFRRGARTVRISLDTYYEHRKSIEAKFGPLKSLSRDRLRNAKMIEHGHLPSDRIMCAICVAEDPALACRLAKSVLDV